MRLIDAEKFKEHFCEENCGNRRCRDEFDKCTFIMALEQEPTAYDLDKVVKEINEWTFNANIDVGDGTVMNHNLIVRDTAIEIVKGGGVNGKKQS